MNPFWISTLLVGAAGAGGAVWLVARLLSYRHAFGARCGAEFTAERYQPMAALLAPDDLEFLAAQPGVSRGEVAAFERQRRAIFRAYLAELAGDFLGLHARARQFVAAAPAQHAELVGDLLRKQVSFWALLTRLEIQLALAPLGVKADARPIMELVGSLGRAVAANTGPVPV